jgi:hypothetical protein
MPSSRQPFGGLEGLAHIELDRTFKSGGCPA